MFIEVHTLSNANVVKLTKYKPGPPIETTTANRKIKTRMYQIFPSKVVYLFTFKIDTVQL